MQATISKEKRASMSNQENNIDEDTKSVWKIVNIAQVRESKNQTLK